MLILPITSQKYNTNLQKTKPSTSFQGQLGEKVLQEITAKTPVNNMLKKLGLGVLGFVSVAKLKDILETWKEKTEADAKNIENLGLELNQVKEGQEKNEELILRYIKLEKTLEEHKIKLDRKEQLLKSRTNTLLQRQVDLDEKEKLLSKKENLFKEKENALNNREKDLAEKFLDLETKKDSLAETVKKEVTAQVKVEEQKKAEENIINIINTLNEREQELNNREKTLLNTEALIKDAEIEKIKNEFRVIFDNNKNFDMNNATSFPLQLYAVTKMLKALGWRTNSSIFYERLVKVMQNKEELITNEMFQFVKNYVGHKIKLSDEDLLVSIVMMKDKNGNLDTERATHAFAIIEGSYLITGKNVIDNIAHYYKIPNPYQLDY